MVNKTSGFAKYSKALCWVVSFIWLVLSVFAFMSDSENGMINGFLWLVGAFAFAISAIFLSRKSQPVESDSGSEQVSEQVSE